MIDINVNKIAYNEYHLQWVHYEARHQSTVSLLHRLIKIDQNGVSKTVKISDPIFSHFRILLYITDGISCDIEHLSIARCGVYMVYAQAEFDPNHLVVYSHKIRPSVLMFRSLFIHFTRFAPCCQVTMSMHSAYFTKPPQAGCFPSGTRLGNPGSATIVSRKGKYPIHGLAFPFGCCFKKVLTRLINKRAFQLDAYRLLVDRCVQGVCAQGVQPPDPAARAPDPEADTPPCGQKEWHTPVRALTH